LPKRGKEGENDRGRRGYLRGQKVMFGPLQGRGKSNPTMSVWGANHGGGTDPVTTPKGGKEPGQAY